MSIGRCKGQGVDNKALGNTVLFDGGVALIVYRCASLPDVPVEKDCISSLGLRRTKVRPWDSFFSARGGSASGGKDKPYVPYKSTTTSIGQWSEPKTPGKMLALLRFFFNALLTKI